jgi:hypothetical protein
MAPWIFGQYGGEKRIMRKAEPQHNHAPNQPAQRQGNGAALESPQGEQIAQLEAVADASPQAGRLAQLAAMANNSPRMAAQRKAISAIHNSPNVTAQRQQLDSLTGETVQREEAEEPLQPKVAQREAAPAKPNNTGLPDNLKSGIESLSGMSMDNVKVHYNSSQPAQLNALAYAQGTDIHVAPGQEQHLPHEAWHVVQQAQGRVKPTMQMKDGVLLNDDASLEHEADVMGGEAVAVGQRYVLMKGPENRVGNFANFPVQMKKEDGSDPQNASKTLHGIATKLKMVMESALSDGWSDTERLDANKLKNIIHFMEVTAAKNNDFFAESLNVAIAKELSSSPLGMEISDVLPSEGSIPTDAIQQVPIVTQRVGPAAIVSGVVGLGMLIGGIYQYMRQGVTSQIALVGKGAIPTGGLEAVVHAEAQLTSPSQYVEYDISWTAGAVPGGTHLGQVQGMASPGWVRDKEPNGVWGIGDRNYVSAAYLDRNLRHDNVNGTLFYFDDHIKQLGLRLGCGTWWFRLSVFNRFGILLRSSQVQIDW